MLANVTDSLDWPKPLIMDMELEFLLAASGLIWWRGETRRGGVVARMWREMTCKSEK